MANDKLSILLTPLSTLGKHRVSRFVDRNDLIQANIASIHLPFFLDGRFASTYRGSLYIDGSFRSSLEDHYPEVSFNSLVVFDFQHDTMLKGRKWHIFLRFVKLPSEDGVFSLLDRGREYAERLDQEGHFDCLPRCRYTPH